MAAIGYRESLGIETKYSVYPEPERPYVPMKDEEVDILEDIELDELSDFSASPKKVSRGLQPRRTVVKPGEMVIDSRGIRSPKLVPPVKKRPKDGSRGLQPRGRVTKPGEMIIDSSGMRVPKPVPPVKKWDKGPYSRPDPYSKHDSVEDNIVGSMMEEDFDMFQIPGIKAGMSDFERDIAKSENMAFWKSDGAEGGVYSDMFMETGKERPASGFGTALREGESSIDFSTAVDRMRESISEAESGVAKIIGEESWGSLDRKQREAITELGYIMGVKGIKTKLPNMIDAIKEGQMELAKQEAMFNMKTGNQAKWITQIGEERAGRILSKLFPDPYEYKSPQSATSLMYYQMPDFLR